MSLDLWNFPATGAQVADQAPAAQQIALDVNTYRSGLPAEYMEQGSLSRQGILGMAEGTGSGGTADWLDVAHRYLFERFHVIVEPLPVQEFRLTLSLGNVLSFQQRTGILWNANFDVAVTVTGIVVNASAVTVSGISLPRVIEPLSDATFLISVDTTGSPIISGDITVQTSVGDFVIPVTGRRVIAFPIVPQRPVSETLRFQTDVIDADDGSDQRGALREVPEQLISYDVKGLDDPMSELHNILFDWMPRLFGVPFYPEEKILSTDLQAGAVSVPIDTAHAEYYAGGLGFILDELTGASEVFEIDVVSPASLDLALSLVGSYGAGSRICPARLCYLDNSVDERAWMINLQQATLRFRAIDNRPIEVVPFDDTYNSIPIFSDLNVVESGTYLRSFSNNFVQSTFGKRPYQVAKQDRAVVTQPKRWATSSQEETWKVRSWMHQLNGQQGVFYLPTFREDFLVTQVIGAADTGINVRNRGYATFVKSREPWSAVQIELTDGTVLRRNIIDASVVDSQTEQISIDSALGVEVQTGEVSRAALIQLCRLGDDQVSLRHDMVGQAVITISARTTRQ